MILMKLLSIAVTNLVAHVDQAPTICAHVVDDSEDIVVLIEKCVAFVYQQFCVNITGANIYLFF